MLRAALRLFGWFCIGVATAFLVLSIYGSPSYQACIAKPKKTESPQPQNEGLSHLAVTLWRSELVRCSGEFIDANRDSLVAVATVVIAIFTITLWGSTYRQVRLSRDEFNATHRPHIKVLQFETVTEVKHGDHLVSACITYVNRGVSSATITEIASAIVTNSDQSPLRPGATFTHKQTMAKKLPSGVHDSYMVPHEGIVLRSHIIAHGLGPSGHGTGGYVVHCIGHIKYADAGGLKRQTGFCRRLSGDGTVWEYVNQPDYEYEY